MKDIQKRRNTLIDLLANADEYLTVKTIASLLGVSERTVHNDLELLSVTHKIIKKSGVGIRLSEEVKTNVQNELSLFERRVAITKQILLAGEMISVNMLKEKYYVSQSSITNDLRWIKGNLLDPFNIELCSDEKGTRVECSENERIRALVALNNMIAEKSQLTFLSEDMIRKTAVIYSMEICKACRYVVDLFRNEQFAQEADYYLLNVYMFLLALIYRMQLGKHMEKELRNELHSTQVMELTNYLLAHDVFDLINGKLSKKVNARDEDIFYLSMVLRANKICFIKTTQKIENYPKKFAIDLIQKMSDVLNIDLSQNMQLKNMIVSHCNAMFERLRNRVYIHNPMLQIIKQEYHAMFKLVWLIIDSVDHEVSKNISEDEIGFLMLYFQNEMEKHKKSKKVIVVCPNGVVASNLIAAKIREFLPPMDIVEVTSIDKISGNDISGYYFIISTAPLEAQAIPVVKVSMLLTNQDIKNIKEMYEQTNEVKLGLHHIGNPLYTKYLSESRIFWDAGNNTKEKVIDVICRTLYAEKAVKEGFLNAVLQREKISSTDIITGGAIPHASCKYVDRTCFALYVSKKPINWGNYAVKAVVVFALAEQDVMNSKTILNEAFSFIREQKTVELLSSANSRDELIKLIYKYGGLND